VPFLFEQQEKRIGPALIASLASHAVFATVIILGMRYAPAREPVEWFPERTSDRIVWLADPGPGGGGGGGGNEMPEPPRVAELPGRDELTVPVEKPPELEAPKEPEPEEPQIIAQLNIPAQTLAAATEALPGTIEAPPGPPTPSQGAGRDGGAGTGRGRGVGPGEGRGLGPGIGGGTGGGVYRPGSGVTLPRLLHEVKPQYTSDAMRAKVQGTVLLECIVRPDGTVSDVQVLRSLDPVFGLDQEAVKAAGQWRFAPGTRFGEPVPVLITIELQFTLR
jgi:TonB family protein